MIDSARRLACLYPGICSCLLACVSALALTACNIDDGYGPSSSSKEFLSGFKPGDSRLLLKEIKAQGRLYGYDLYSLAEIRIEKDTVIEGDPAKAFTITASELFPESTHVSVERNYLVAQGDSLNLYRDKEGYAGFLFGLLKQGSYDTARFSDKTSEWVFPLLADSRWLTRPTGGKGWSLEKEWIGYENLEFEGSEYACHVFVLHSVVDLKSWVASVGLLKAEIDYGPSPYADSAGNVLDTLQMQERYELLKLNPTASETAAAKVKYKSISLERLP